jgi:outer membrane protein TolC
MKQLIITFIITITFGPGLFSQSTIDGILMEIEKNNTTLSAVRKSAEAEKLGNKTGIYLENPEVGFNYLWGNPSAIGNRTDFNITQTFDFPSAYRYKNQISDSRNVQVELGYQKQLRELLLQTRLICYDLIYTNALKSELSKRLTHAQRIANSYKSQFDIGESNILEYNKAQLNLLNISKELELLEIDRTALLADLTRLNGGFIINFTDSVFQSSEIPVDFEKWCALAEQNNPLLGWLKQEIEIGQNQEKLNRAMSLPKLKAGYMSEKIIGETLQGVTVGITIPLWENKNTVKYAAAQTIALQGIETDNKLQFYNQLKILHTSAIGLQKSVDDYRAKLIAFDNSELLAKALDLGEITLIEYIVEFAIYYKSINRLLNLERELFRTLAKLNQYM